MAGVTKDLLGQVNDRRPVEHRRELRSTAEHLGPVQRSRKARGAWRLMRLDNTVAEDGYLLPGEQAREHHEPVPREVTFPLAQRSRRRHGGPTAPVTHHATSRHPRTAGARSTIGHLASSGGWRPQGMQRASSERLPQPWLSI
jgi:hypothetical protein